MKVNLMAPAGKLTTGNKLVELASMEYANKHTLSEAFLNYTPTGRKLLASYISAEYDIKCSIWAEANSHKAGLNLEECSALTAKLLEV